jgi:hypothetical protein
MFFLEKALSKGFRFKRVKGEAPWLTVASMLHWFLLWVQTSLLKGKYPQVQILQPPFPAGVTVEQRRGSSSSSSNFSSSSSNC